MALTHNMGGTSVFTTTAGIKFSDGTEQNTAATGLPTFPITNEGSTIALGSTGITMTDPFGNVFSMDVNQIGFSSPGGGFNMLFDGTEWISITADGSGNALFLGPAFAGQQ